MASSGTVENLRFGDLAPDSSDNAAADAAFRARFLKKRTKTGCLTCRKRRIKCGEERPVCRNCVKSKRQCEGYNQRVVFKQPSLDQQPISNGGAHVTFQAGHLPGPILPYGATYNQALDTTFYPQSQPQPQPQPIAQYAPVFPKDEHQTTISQQQHSSFTTAPDPSRTGIPYYYEFGNQNNVHYPATNGTVSPDSHTQIHSSNELYPSHTQTIFQPVQYTTQLAPQSSVAATNGQSAYQQSWQPIYPSKLEQQLPGLAPITVSTVDPKTPISSVSPKTLSWSQSSIAEVWNQGSSQAHQPRSNLSRSVDTKPPLATSLDTSPTAPASTSPAVQPPYNSPPEFYEYEQHLPSSSTTNNFLSQAAVEVQDDDYYDIDDEMDVDTLALAPYDHGRHQGLQNILQVNNIDIQDLHTRRYDTFLYEGILDHYRVEDAANPLKNPATARVFAHFISVTAPGLSVFERHPRNTSVLFTDGHIPFSQRGTWTYTLPVAAMKHQGLLHSMLALASLHIARLQNASDTPSRQHYAWACKKINSLLGPKSKKRHKTTTIAASMLLGMYEIFTADHRAWNLHLSGTKQLFVETDFVTMARQFRTLKRDRAARQLQTGNGPSGWLYGQTQDELLDLVPDVDDTIVSRLVGKEVTYEGHGQTEMSQSREQPDLDLGYFEILRDLYWWYLKQDAYQSIISGNPLLLEYSRWPNCPPRAPIGRQEAVYGSFDHLMLLLGRIADFACKDRQRKLKQMDAHGGQWKPAPGMKVPQPPSHPNRSQPATPLSASSGPTISGDYFAGPSPHGPPPPQQPLFYGMAPLPRQNVQMPLAYNPHGAMPTPQPTSPKEDIDMRAATNAALEEYGRIRAALREFENSLGETFNPLPPEYQQPMETPFGDALFYRSYDIGCLWALYYMAVIIAIRSHPHMHPAAHAAAAIASQETAFFANEIGRITAGIAPGPPDQPLNPTVGAALAESCLPAFFAAIQYTNPQQRHATVMRIHNIALRTGWGTAEIIANGCETAWVKAAAMGRGPPYTRIARPKYSEDPRLNGRADALDLRDMPDERDDQDRRLVKTKSDARLTWAIGILGMEEDNE